MNNENENTEASASAKLAGLRAPVGSCGENSLTGYHLNGVGFMTVTGRWPNNGGAATANEGRWLFEQLETVSGSSELNPRVTFKLHGWYEGEELWRNVLATMTRYAPDPAPEEAEALKAISAKIDEAVEELEQINRRIDYVDNVIEDLPDVDDLQSEVSDLEDKAHDIQSEVSDLEDKAQEVLCQTEDASSEASAAREEAERNGERWAELYAEVQAITMKSKTPDPEEQGAFTVGS